MQSNREVLRRWYKQVWEEGDWDAAREILHPDCKAYDFPTPQATMGRDAFIAYIQNFRCIFTGIRIDIQDMVEENDKVVVRLVAHMRHTGHGLGFPATRETVRLAGISLSEMRDRQIYAGWNYFDVAGEVARLAHIAKSRQPVLAN